MPKYELNEAPTFNISNDGRQTEVKIVTDNIGRTRIQFDNTYCMIIEASDLETIVENLNSALDIHKETTLNKFQEALPFGGEEGSGERAADDPSYYNFNEEYMDDPRGW